MKKKLLSLILVAVMILSTFAIIPVTAAEAANTWADGNYVITTLADLQAFEAEVEGGNSFSGKTITLAADIVLPSTWNGIGNDTKYFSGTFNGGGHTLTMSGHEAVCPYCTQANGAIFNRLDDATVRDFNVNGYMRMIGDSNDCGSYFGVVVEQARGTVLIENVVCSTWVVITKYVKQSGTILGQIHSSATSNVTLKNCVFNGTVVGNERVKDFGGLVGTARVDAHTLNMEGCVYAGYMMFDGGSSGYFGPFFGWMQKASTLNMSNCYSVGTIRLTCSSPAECYTLGEISSTVTKNISNVYYINNFSSDKGGTWKDVGGVEKTAEEMSALTDWEEVDYLPIQGNLGGLHCTIKNTDYRDLRGVTVGLTADVVLPSDWTGIGDDIGSNDNPFYNATFDGRGHTITMSGHTSKCGSSNDLNGAVFNLIKDATVKNFTVDGSMTMTTGANQAAVVVGACGTSKIENVRCSVKIKTSGNIQNSGAILGYTFGGNAADVTIDGCVFDGTVNVANGMQQFGVIVGMVTSGKNVVIKNTVNAGTVMFNDHQASYSNGAWLGKVSAGTISIKDSYSLAQMTFDKGLPESPKTWGDNQINYVVAGVPGATISLENFYYLDIKNGNGTDMALSSAAISADNGAMTKDEIAALTAEDFSADANFEFKVSASFDAYCPCPAALVGANGEWIPALIVANNANAKVLGAQIRCTDESDLYSGIRFVGQFKADAVSNAGTTDANFGLVLIAKEFYDAAEDKATIEGLLAAGGVDVQATQVDDSIDGYYRVNAVVYEITAEHYTDEIVVVAYIDGELVGSATTRSIYQVATKCVADSSATAAQKTFCNGIINSVEG